MADGRRRGEPHPRDWRRMDMEAASVMTPSPNHPLWCRIIVLAASILFLWTAYSKLRAPSEFAETLRQHHAIPHTITETVAWCVPSVELAMGLIGIAVALIGRGVSQVGIAYAVLFAGFTAYAILLHVRPPPSPAGCGCGFSKSSTADWSLIAAYNGTGTAILAAVSWRTLPSRR